MKKHAKKLCACLAVASVLVFAGCVVEHDPGEAGDTLDIPKVGNISSVNGEFIGESTTLPHANHRYFRVRATLVNGELTTFTIESDQCWTGNNRTCNRFADMVHGVESGSGSYTNAQPIVVTGGPVISNQSFRVDSIGGATRTSTAFREAGEDIIRQVKMAL